MEKTEFIWLNGEFIPWDDAKFHVLTHGLHYGTGVFEGVRFYETAQGPAIFQLQAHTDRFFYSANAIKMEIAQTPDQINQACVDLINKNGIKQGYLRPIAYYGYGKMGLNPAGCPTDVAIACWPWGAYLPHDMVDLKISSYIRIHPRSSVTDAKICGHYVNSVMAVQELAGTNYHEALLLDFEGNIAEGPGENLFIVKDGVISTPPLGTILAGITRRTVVELAEELGIQLVERSLTPDDVFGADEAFFTGTAAEVTPIRAVDDKVIGAGEIGPVTNQIRTLFLDVVYGRNEKFSRLLTLTQQ